MPTVDTEVVRTLDAPVSPYVTLGEFRAFTAEFPDSMMFCVGVRNGPGREAPATWTAAYANCLNRGYDVIHLSGDVLRGETG